MMWPQQIPAGTLGRFAGSDQRVDPIQAVSRVAEIQAPLDAPARLELTPEEVPPREAPLPLPSFRHSEGVGGWMQGVVATCLPSQTLGELAELLSLHHISGAPVVDEQGLLLGVVSQSDIAHSLGLLYSAEVRGRSQGFYKELLGALNPLDPAVQTVLQTTTVAELLNPHLYSVSPDASLDEVIELMLREHIHRVPVVFEGKLVGLVSTLDALRVVRDRHLVVK